MPVPISVIVPCYNCRETIRFTIESILNQTLLPSEVLLIDDCSSDQSYEYLLEFALKSISLPIVVLRTERNSGPGAARNLGWDVASYEWLAFLDADDVWHPQKIELHWNFLSKNPMVCLSGHGTSLLDYRINQHMNSDYSVRKIGLLKMLFSSQLPTRTVILRKSVPFRFGDKKVAEDYLLWLEIIASGYASYRLNSTLAFSLRPDYSKGGYSGQLWKQEKRELSAIWRVYRNDRLHWILMAASFLWSFIKFNRRWILVNFGLKR